MRSRNSFGLIASILLLGGSAILVDGQATEPQEWGSLKGQVVWAEKVIPTNPPIPGVPPGPCRAKGPILKNNLVIDPKSRGVRWVLVWLADPKDATNVKFSPPIHPALANPPDAKIDTPCCEYQPRMVGRWGKQKLIVENTGVVAHAFLIASIGKGPNENALVPPKGRATVEGFVPKLLPTPYSCGVHRWMKGYIGSFAHPYFAVTDADGKFEIKNAPTGKFQLVVWHEETGFLTQPELRNRRIRGKVIEIEGDRVTEVGKIGMKQVED